MQFNYAVWGNQIPDYWGTVFSQAPHQLPNKPYAIDVITSRNQM